jgi:L-rhamnose isomerase
MNYLKSLYTDNDIFLRRDEIKRVGFLKKVIEWIQNLKKLGIDFGKEISE